MSLARFRATNHPQQTGKRGAVDAVDDRGTPQEFIDALEARFGKFTLDVAAAEHNAKAPKFYTREDDGLACPWGWFGRRCVMCSGTGLDRASVLGESDEAGTRPVVAYQELDGPCRACGGHRREPHQDEPPARVWCNPPYSDCGAWVRKAWHEWTGGGQSSRAANGPEFIAMLLPANRVEQGWWQDHIEPHRDRPDSPLRVEFQRGRMRFDRPNWTPGPKGDRPPFGLALLIWGGGAR